MVLIDPTTHIKLGNDTFEITNYIRGNVGTFNLGHKNQEGFLIQFIYLKIYQNVVVCHFLETNKQPSISEETSSEIFMVMTELEIELENLSIDELRNITRGLQRQKLQSNIGPEEFLSSMLKVFEVLLGKQNQIEESIRRMLQILEEDKEAPIIAERKVESRDEKPKKFKKN